MGLVRQLAYGLGDFCQGQLLVHGAQIRSSPRHAINDTASFILANGDGTLLLEGFQTFSTVFAEARQYNANDAVRMIDSRFEHLIHRRVMTIVGGAFEISAIELVAPFFDACVQIATVSLP